MSLPSSKIGPLWGMVLQPGVRQTVSLTDFDLLVMRATLADPVDESPVRTSLKMSFTMKPGSPLEQSPANPIVEVTLCSLIPRQSEIVMLDLSLPSHERITFEVSGPKAVSLCGHYIVPASYSHGIGQPLLSQSAQVASASGSRPASVPAAAPMKLANNRKRAHAGDGDNGPSPIKIKIEPGTEPNAMFSSGGRSGHNAVASGSATPKIDLLKVGNKVVKTDTKIGQGAEARRGCMAYIQLVGKVQHNKTVFARQQNAEGYGFRVGDGDMLPGLDEGILGMRVGGERTLVIPPSLGYGQKGLAGSPGVPPNATLIVDLVLIKVE